VTGACCCRMLPVLSSPGLAWQASSSVLSSNSTNCVGQ
jgi:hypothetical protein